MITTVSLNPSIDRTITINGFRYGGLNRAYSSRDDIGGKAINVSLCAAQYKMETECIGFMYRENGTMFERQLARAGVGFDFVWVEGSVRTNIKLLDESTQDVTEINTSGGKIDEQNFEQMLEMVVRHAESSDYIVFTGSLPQGCPDDAYRTMIEAVEGMDCKAVLDADGNALMQGLKARPFLIKPNRKELEGAIGRSIETFDEIRQAAKAYIDHGIENVVVSLGKDGAYYTNGTEELFADPMDVKVCSTVGAGDALISGMLFGFSSEMEPSEAFRHGIASATACVMTEGTSFDIRKQAMNLLSVVNIRRIE